mmetsp:Transcript_151072/g.263277  ORF Transcript_151072/g.263277 Transcript_151072/m.263277 type:complete len:426 (-) Transcript_151072:77-1354(-)
MAKEVGEEDLENEEFIEGDPFDDGYGMAEDEDMEDAAGIPAKEEDEAPAPKKPARRFELPGAGATIAVKKQVATPARTAKSELGGEKLSKPKADPENRAPLTAWELFRESKRTEASTRDLGAKAICRIKHGIRQPDSQKDGRPFIPPDWDKRFKPILGHFKKFILMRPDQFKIVPGPTPDLFTLEVVSNQIVTAPSFDSLKGKKGKKGKGKGKAKGTSWDALVSGKDSDKGSDKGWGKGKGKKGKDKGKGDFKGKGKGKAPWKGSSAWNSSAAEEEEPTPPQEPPPKFARKAPQAPAAPPTRAAMLLAEAAREALAEEEEEAMEEEAGEEDQAADEYEEEAAADEAAENGEAEEGAAGEEEEAGVDEDPMEQLFKEASAEAEEEGQEDTAAAADAEPDMPMEPKHGTFINTLLSGSLLGGLKRRR